MSDVDVDRLVRMAEGCAGAIRQKVGELEALGVELADLDGRTCTGVEYWRREMGKPDRLYINHSVDAACSSHGKPSPGGRLRCYVGSDPARVEEARAAMAREARRAELERQAQTIRQGLASCGYRLRAVYGALGCQVEEGGQW